jgi:hypothetical protein
MECIFSEVDKDLRDKLILRNRDKELEFLKENWLVLFITWHGPEAKKIQFSNGASLIGYSRNQLKGTDFSIIIPKAFRRFHEQGNVLIHVFQTLETHSVFKSMARMYLEDSQGYLVPITMKLRLILDV